MKIFKMSKKSEKGSITVMVLAAMMFMLIVITLSYLDISNKSIAQDKKISKIVKQYQVTNEEIKQEYVKVYNGVDFTNGLGDVNSDKVIDQEDVNIIKAYLQGTNDELSDEQKLRADINKDEQITHDDLQTLEEYVKNKSTDI